MRWRCFRNMSGRWSSCFCSAFPKGPPRIILINTFAVQPGQGTQQSICIISLHISVSTESLDESSAAPAAETTSLPSAAPSSKQSTRSFSVCVLQKDPSTSIGTGGFHISPCCKPVYAFSSQMCPICLMPSDAVEHIAGPCLVCPQRRVYAPFGRSAAVAFRCRH